MSIVYQKYRTVKVKAYEVEEGDIVIVNNDKRVVTHMHEINNQPGVWLEFDKGSPVFFNYLDDRITLAIPQ